MPAAGPPSASSTTRCCPVLATSEADFDPPERERLRQVVERYGGDGLLLTLSDEELDGARGFIRSEAQRRMPTGGSVLLLHARGAGTFYELILSIRARL